MKKKELKKLRSLQATGRMLELAKAEVPEKDGYRNQERYRHNLFMRCQVEKGILKAALFATRDLRLGSRTPLYEVYVDRKARSFVTWDTVYGRWREAKANRLNVFQYLYTLLLYMPDYKDKPAGVEAMMPWSEFIKERCCGVMDTETERPEKRGQLPS